MVLASIIINQVGKTAGAPGESREDLSIGDLVTLTNISNTDVITWNWELISAPNDSAAALSGSSTSTATFTPDLTGSYLIQLTVNGYIQTRIIAAVLTGVVRFPAPQEAKEFGGWERAVLNVFEEVDSGPRPPNGTASGDLSGTYPSPTVSKILGRTLSSAVPTNGQVLSWSATNSWWIPDTPNLGGAASGDLSGNYPSPTVVKLQGRAVSASVPTDGYGLTWSVGSNQWICSKPSPGGVAGGDLLGLYPRPVVKGLYGRPMSSTVPAVNQVLRWTGTEWAPAGSVASVDRILVFSDDTELSSTIRESVVKKSFRIIRDSVNPPSSWRIVLSAWINSGIGASAEILVKAAWGGGIGDTLILSTPNPTETVLSGDIVITESREPVDSIITFTFALCTTNTPSTAYLQYTDVYAVY